MVTSYYRVSSSTEHIEQQKEWLILVGKDQIIVVFIHGVDILVINDRIFDKATTIDLWVENSDYLCV